MNGRGFDGESSSSLGKQEQRRKDARIRTQMLVALHDQNIHVMHRQALQSKLVACIVPSMSFNTSQQTSL